MSCSPNIGFDMDSYIQAFIGFAVFALYITLCCVRSLSLANADTVIAKFLSREKQERLSSTFAKFTSLELISQVTQDDGILPRNNVQSKFRVETTTSLACIHPLELSACNDFGTSSRGSYGREYQERIGPQSSENTYTTLGGIPVSDDNNSLTIGDSGSLTLEDLHLFEKHAHFNRERLPERVVHAKGGGAHGYFEVTRDVSDICKAAFLNKVGKKTPVFGRFSTVGGEAGSADTARDPRGFALKFYTEEGIWDMVGNNTPVFFIRDGLKFPDLIHTQKRNPQTHLKDPNAVWDFFSLVPESVHQVLMTFSPRGTPDGFRHMHGFGSHTFKWVNKDGKGHWVKYHFMSDQGIKNLSPERAVELSGTNPDYAIEDLFLNIQNGNGPSWTFSVQVMPLEDAANYKWDPFDLTKVWSHKDYPLREVGKLRLDKNPTNYFAEVEQCSFSPAHMVPGIEPSPDRILQTRLFAYHDAGRHRLGVNFLQIPINTCPFAKVHTYARDGLMTVNDNGGNTPNYFPNSYSELPQPDPSRPDIHPYKHTGGIVGRSPNRKWSEQDDFEQPRLLWKLMSADDQEQTVNNIANSMHGVKDNIVQRQLGVFKHVDESLAKRVEDLVKMKKSK